MKKFRSHTLNDYLSVLSSKNPVPGGGSAAALTGALGAALIGMVTRYSVGKGKNKSDEAHLKKILKESQKIQRQFLELIDRDAEAYLKVVKTRKSSSAQKKKAQDESRRVPAQVCQLCYKAVELTPFLVARGNQYLISDVVAAVELLLASFKSAFIFTRET